MFSAIVFALGLLAAGIYFIRPELFQELLGQTQNKPKTRKESNRAAPGGKGAKAQHTPSLSGDEEFGLDAKKRKVGQAGNATDATAAQGNRGRVRGGGKGKKGGKGRAAGAPKVNLTPRVRSADSSEDEQGEDGPAFSSRMASSNPFDLLDQNRAAAQKKSEDLATPVAAPTPSTGKGKSGRRTKSKAASVAPIAPVVAASPDSSSVSEDDSYVKVTPADRQGPADRPSSPESAAPAPEVASVSNPPVTQQPSSGGLKPVPRSSSGAQDHAAAARYATQLAAKDVELQTLQRQLNQSQAEARKTARQWEDLQASLASGTGSDRQTYVQQIKSLETKVESLNYTNQLMYKQLGANKETEKNLKLQNAQLELTQQRLRESEGTLRNEVDQLSRAVDQLRSERMAYYNDKDSHSRQMHELKSNHTALLAELNGSQSTIQQLRAEADQNAHALAQKDRALASLESIVQSYKDESEDSRSLRSDYDQLLPRFQALEAEHRTALQARQDLETQLKEAREQAGQSTTRSRSEVEAAQRETAALQARVESLERDAQQAASEHDSELQRLQAELETARRDAAELESLQARLAGVNEELAMSERTRTATTAELQGNLDAARRQAADLEAQVEQLTQSGSTHSEELAAVRAAEAELNQTLVASNASLAAAEEQKTASEAALRQAQADLETVRETDKANTEKIARLTKALDTAKALIQTLKSAPAASE
ncbi:hypothetical protein IWQ60_000449 [Tieghemiomyces parasiticus]|uniref:Uncharacterized protein n=1 Tax=Tieghemiomyces parasiticus TaxID=78921 RepID=A0A9W8AIH3_9FUNG|nr:hypothetical protein IWQ60_000449 [Tieghemiomyces parasiticus]